MVFTQPSWQSYNYMDVISTPNALRKSISECRNKYAKIKYYFCFLYVKIVLLHLPWTLHVYALLLQGLVSELLKNGNSYKHR